MAEEEVKAKSVPERLEGQKRNILSTSDEGDFILERRRVFRNGMKEPKEYDLKLPKTLEAARKIYGEAAFLKAGNATLRTDNDDAVEKEGKPISEATMIGKAIKGVSPEALEAIKRILKGDKVKADGKAEKPVIEKAKEAEKAGRKK